MRSALSKGGQLRPRNLPLGLIATLACLSLAASCAEIGSSGRDEAASSADPTSTATGEPAAAVPGVAGVKVKHSPAWTPLSPRPIPELLGQDGYSTIRLMGGDLGTVQRAVHALQDVVQESVNEPAEYVTLHGWPAVIVTKPFADKKGNAQRILIGAAAMGPRFVRFEAMFRADVTAEQLAEARAMFLDLEVEVSGPSAWADEVMKALRARPARAGEAPVYIEVAPLPAGTAVPPAAPSLPAKPSGESGALGGDKGPAAGGGSPSVLQPPEKPGEAPTATSEAESGFLAPVNAQAGVDSEIEIAVSADGQYIVQVNNGVDIRVSSDFGMTFNAAIQNPAAPFGGNQGDPSITRAASGTFYFAYISRPATGCGTGIATATETQVDGVCVDGTGIVGDCDFADCPGPACGCNALAGSACQPTFSAGPIVQNAIIGTGFFADQEHIAADPVNTATTGGGDMIYAVWRNFSGGPGLCGNFAVEAAQIACSHDGGTTWSAPVAVDGTTTAGFHPRVTVGPDGTAWAIYQNNIPFGVGQTTQILIRPFAQCNNAATWGGAAGAPIVVDTINFGNGIQNTSTWPATPAAGAGNWDLVDPIAGLDRQAVRGTFLSPMMAVDTVNANTLMVAYALSTVRPVPNAPAAPGATPFPGALVGSTTVGNDNIVVSVSTDRGVTWNTRQVLNAAPAGRRFLPWICADNGQAFASWYDQRLAVWGGMAPQNDLTDYFARGFTLTGNAVNLGTELRLSPASDPICQGNAWASPTGGGDAAETCSAQPQLAGQCATTLQPCDFSDCNGDSAGGGCPCCATPPCGGGNACVQATGAPAYGDYNGNACANGRFYASWASGQGPTDIDAFVACPPDPSLANPSLADNTPPVIEDTPLPPVSTEICAGASSGTVTLTPPRAYDICGTMLPVVTGELTSVQGTPVAVPIPASNTITLPPGIHEVSWTAVDAFGLSSPPAVQIVQVLALEDAATCCGGLQLLTGTPGPDLLLDPDGTSWCLLGFEGQDEVTGTPPGPDILFGGGNQDNVNGLTGSDVIYGGGGEDAITSLGGTIFAGEGSDAVDLNGAGTADLGDGSDAFLGTFGDHVIIPGDGIDAVEAGLGNDTVIINDLCEIRPTELLDGGFGSDTLQAPLPCATGDLGCALGILATLNVVAIGFENFVADASRTHLATCLCERELCGDGVDNDCDGAADETGSPEVCGDLADNDCDGFPDEFPDCPSCNEETATVQQHVAAGRAYAVTSTLFFLTFTDYFTTGSNIPLGNDPNATVTLAELPAGSGLWIVGICDLCDSGETCGDFLDNDCDGTVDDGCSCTPAPCLPFGCGTALWNGCGDPTNPANTQTCSCGTGQLCTSPFPGIIGICLGGCVPSPELCDGADNDCNPLTPDGNAEPTLGNTCDNPADSDACPDGNVVCAGGALSCTDDGASNTEVCDGADNDCNGTVDDGAFGPEVCGDTLDNDCDGTVNDGCPTCTQVTATLSAHQPAGRATTTTSISFFTIITTWRAVGSGDVLGTNPNTVVTLRQEAPGVWRLGPCPAVCGDGVCAATESCTACSADCGACPACINHNATLNAHRTAGRAYTQTQTFFFFTTTTWFAVGSNDVLGTNGNLVVNLAEQPPGFFELGSCP